MVLFLPRTVKTRHHLAPLILASTSPYRRELLARLGIPFAVADPRVDEARLPGESPVSLAERLATAKAKSLAAEFPDALLIGSDQVACVDDAIFGKSLNRPRAIAQLTKLSGQVAVFHTAVCLYNAANGSLQVRNVPTEVRFRKLVPAAIERYLNREPAFNCAGSAKSEGLGISLLDYLRGDDPTALIGLPLIALCAMLRSEGIELP